MSKITLNSVADLTQSATAQTTINTNSSTVQTAFDNTLSRDGTSPNQMGAALDMNSNQILNLPAPTTNNSAVRLVDINNLAGGGTVNISPMPSGGISNQVLAKNSATNFDASWKSTIVPAGGSQGQYLAKNTGTDFDVTWHGVTSVNPVDFGADPTGTNDSAAAINAALAFSPFIRFPVGTFKILSAITYNIPANFNSVRIEGAGQELTILNWSSGGNGIIINFNSFKSSAHVRDLTMETGVVNSGQGLSFILSTLNANAALSSCSDVQNVTFRGNDGLGQTNCWIVGFAINNVSNVNAINCAFFGSGAPIHGTGSIFSGNSGISSPAVVVNYIGCLFVDLSSGITLSDFFQGVTVNNCNFVGGTTGINSSGSNLGPQLHVLNSQFGVVNSINIGGNVIPEICLIGNLFICTPTGTCLVFNQTQGLIISGNHFTGVTPTSNTAILTQNTVANSGVVISGNYITQFFLGISLPVSAANVLIADNVLLGNTTNISNLSSSLFNKFHHNVGYNPVGTTAAATMGASPFTVTAGPSAETHYVRQSATNTATVTKGGQQMATLAGASTYYNIELEPNESYITTWVTTAPTYTKDVH